jgi:hypothetical protein
MNKQILICSIFRNREKFVDRWYLQLNKIAEHYKNKYNFTISIYENDSTDKTREKLLSLKNKNFKNIFLKVENINTYYYPSVADENRVKNLANARNSCLDIENINYLDFEKVIFIEPDFRYETEDAIKIISADDIHNKKFDIISGISLSYDRFYDGWATRVTSEDRNCHTTIANTIDPFWSTFSGFCCYNAKPFSEGVRFGWFNDRLNTFDCDTAVICENFRKNNYHEIYMDRSAIFYHED